MRTPANTRGWHRVAWAGAQGSCRVCVTLSFIPSTEERREDGGRKGGREGGKEERLTAGQALHCWAWPLTPGCPGSPQRALQGHWQSHCSELFHTSLLTLRTWTVSGPPLEHRPLQLGWGLREGYASTGPEQRLRAKGDLGSLWSPNAG